MQTDLYDYEPGAGVRPGAALSFDKPMLVCLGGIESQEEQGLLRFAQAAERLLEGDALKEHMHFYSARYGSDTKDRASIIHDFLSHGATSRLNGITDSYGGDFVAQHLGAVIPDATDLSGAQREECLSDAASKLGKLNFFAFSMGTLMLTHIGRHLEQHLLDKGYSEQEAHALMKHIKSVSVADVGYYCHETIPEYFTSLRMVSHDDKYIKRLDKLHTNPQQKSVDCSVPAGKPNTVFVSIAQPTDGIVWGSSTENPLSETEAYNDRIGHRITTYGGLRASEEGNTLFPRAMLQSALRNILILSEGEKLPDDPRDLLKPASPEAATALGMKDIYLGNASGYRYALRMEHLLKEPARHVQ